VGRTAALLTPRVGAFVVLATLVGAYYAVAESLTNFSVWAEVAILAFLVIPAVFGLVYLALPLWKAPNLLPAGLVVAVVAVVLWLAGLEVLSNFAKLAAVTLLAWWFLTFFETAAWVVAVS